VANFIIHLQTTCKRKSNECSLILINNLSPIQISKVVQLYQMAKFGSQYE